MVIVILGIFLSLFDRDRMTTVITSPSVGIETPYHVVIIVLYAIYNHMLYCYFFTLGFGWLTLLYLCLMRVRVEFYSISDEQTLSRLFNSVNIYLDVLKSGHALVKRS